MIFPAVPGRWGKERGKIPCQVSLWNNIVKYEGNLGPADTKSETHVKVAICFLFLYSPTLFCDGGDRWGPTAPSLSHGRLSKGDWFGREWGASSFLGTAGQRVMEGPACPGQPCQLVAGALERSSLSATVASSKNPIFWKCQCCWSSTFLSLAKYVKKDRPVGLGGEKQMPAKFSQTDHVLVYFY